MIFNTIEVILKNNNKKIFDIAILDCFCGSGALGLESISRGCKKVFFLDNSEEAIRLTTKNLKLIKIEKYPKIYKSDFRNSDLPEFYVDLFFLDPPYHRFKIQDVLKVLVNQKFIKKNSIGVFEHPKSDPVDNLNDFIILKVKKVSKSLFYFIEKK
jgi:16S rRNA (guanine(966)-N(2))-methyltransferase RsmD